MEKLGYARVSTGEQNPDLQISALNAAGVSRIFQDRGSGGKFDRPQLLELLKHLRKGDTLVVWKLDRLSRSLKDLLVILDQLERKGVGFQSITEAIDTSTAAGRAMMKMVGVFAEFEREIIRERTKAGLDNARKHGRCGGRPRRLTPAQEAAALEMIASGRKTKADVARLFQVHPSLISRLPNSQA